MSMFDRLTGSTALEVTEETDTVGRITFMAEQLEAATSTIDMLQESLADVELAREDAGWRRIGAFVDRQMSRDGLNRSAELCRVMVAANPLVKRGLQLRHAYVWGSGVEIEARDKENTDLIDVLTAHMDTNEDVLFGAQAQEELERALGTDGNLFLAHFTKPLSGRVKVRALPFSEFTERVTNPDDRDETWFYLRRWTAEEIDSTGRRQTVQNEAFYPDLAYRPRARPKMIDDVEIMWDAPIRHVSVNRLEGQDWGLGDAFAAIDWARAYSDYLNDWARLMKALAKYAWRVTADNKAKAGNAASQIRKNTAGTGELGPATKPAGGAGATAVMAGATLEAIPKSGATLDAESGRPLAAMVAAALGLPVTMLLADPGQTGARAVAETLDRPTILEFKGRQRLWQRVYGDSLRYAVLQAVKAPRGPLTGTLGRDEWDAETFQLPGDADETIEVTFGELDDLDPKTLLEAIDIADGLGKVPDLVILRAALMALPGVEDIDEIIKSVTDDQGNFIPPTMTAGKAALDAFDQGRDPGLTAKPEPDAGN